ncbi:unnamed protein product, partial [Rangifer tarandus platyrhynchus]
MGPEGGLGPLRLLKRRLKHARQKRRACAVGSASRDARLLPSGSSVLTVSERQDSHQSSTVIPSAGNVVFTPSTGTVQAALLPVGACETYILSAGSAAPHTGRKLTHPPAHMQLESKP